MRNSTFFDWKKRLAIVSGVLIFLISAFNSKNGFVGADQSDWLLAGMGWAFAVAATSAEFMFTSDFKKLNWSLIFLGVCAYIYSIWTNVLGLQQWRGTATQYDVVNILGGIFMDVYPEAAIAWALGESRLGDMLGNLVKTTKRGDELTDTQPKFTTPQPVDRMNQYREQNPYQPKPAVSARPQPRPMPAVGTPHPSYHPVSFMPMEEEEE